MKKFISFLLAFTMIFGSLASAAPGDYIYLGTNKESRKLYKEGIDEDARALTNDILAGADVENFYKELDDGNFINIVEEENAHEAYIEKFIKDKNIDSEDLPDYINKNNNKEMLQAELNKITNELGKTFDDIEFPGKGNINDYFEDSKVPGLNSRNYEDPSPGSDVGTTKITTKEYPRNANNWIVKVSSEDFKDLEFNEKVEGSKPYTSQGNISVEVGDYLLLGAVDGGGRLKAYTSIKIEESMIRFAAVKDESIEASFTKSETFSGATRVKITSDHDGGTWKIAPLKDTLTTIFKDSTFDNTKDYKENVELVLASDEELDKDLEGFKRNLIIFKEYDKGQIEKYNIFELKKENVSRLLNAPRTLEEKKDNEEVYNYTKPVKGEKASSTKIVELKSPEDADGWMYALVDSDPTPKLDRPYEGAKTYKPGDDIEVKDKKYLMLLATKDGKVRAYDIVELADSMIKDPPAFNMAEDKGAYLKDPIKGDKVGSTNFPFLRYGNLKFKYKISDNPISIPEKDSISDWSDIEIEGLKTKDIEIFKEDAAILKADEGFKRYMMLVAVDTDKKVQAFYKLELNPSNVALPEAEKLNKTFTNVSDPIKGSIPGSTKILDLDLTSLLNVKEFKYKFIDEDMKIEYNTILSGSKRLLANRDIRGATNGQFLLVVGVDSHNKTKYYKTFKLEEGKSGNLASSNASFLEKGDYFNLPLAGSIENSTKVPFLRVPSGASKFMYKVIDERINFIEANVPLEGSEDLTANTDISPVKANQFLLILATDDSGNVKYQYSHMLSSENIKGGKSESLLEELNYTITKGTDAGTTQFTKLDGSGLANSSNTFWKYKLVESIPEEKDRPYEGSIVHGSSKFFRANSNIKVNPYNDNNYGYILLLATDSAGKTKGYGYIELNSANVKEHAPIIKNASLKAGSKIDTTKLEITNGDSNKVYKYIITKKEFKTPSLGDFLPVNHVDYKVGNDISVSFDDHLTIFELDEKGHIGGFKSFKIDIDSDPNIVKQAKASLKLDSKSISKENDTLLEGEIRNGGHRLLITLEDATWIENLARDEDLRDKLYKGLLANNQSEEWNKLINTLIDSGFGNIGVSGNNLTISLVETSGYDISEKQEITMLIHPDLIKGAKNPVHASGILKVDPTIGAEISGHVVDELIRASDLKKGNKQIVINLKDGHWKQTIDENLLKNGFKSSGKNSMKVFEALKPDNIQRNNSTQTTITLPAIDNFKWTGSQAETITLNINPELLIDANQEIVASPSFTFYPDILKVNGLASVDGNLTDEILFKAPDGKEVKEDSNTWRIAVDTGTLKDDLSINDLIVSALPKGLKASASKAEEKNIINIVISGTSTTKITDSQVFVSIKGSAVTEPNSVASDSIELKLKLADTIDFSNIKYSIDGGNLNFTGINSEMEYKTSLDNVWNPGGAEDTTITLPLTPMVLTVREKAQSKVTKEFKFEFKDPPSGVSINSYEYSDDGENLSISLKGDKPTMEYSTNGGNSYNAISAINTRLDLDSHSDLRLRYKAVNTKYHEDGNISEAGELPSKATPKLNGEFLGDVILSAEAGKILKTNANMEYSLKSSNGSDGIWENAKLNETPVNFALGNDVYIRDKQDHKNFRSLGKINQAKKPNLGQVDFNIKEGFIINKSDQALEYRFNKEAWNEISEEKNLGIEFKTGILEFRIKANGDTLASEPRKKEPSIPAMKSEPLAEIDDVKNKILSINGINPEEDWKSFEYRINPNSVTPWNNGNFLKNEDLSGDKKVEIRAVAEKYELPSKTNKSINFTKNLDMSHVVLSDYTNPPVLNGTSNLMEYKVEAIGKTLEWTQARNGDTPLPDWFKSYWDNDLISKVSVRDRRADQQSNIYHIVDRTPSEDSRLDKISYKFKDNKLIFSNISSSMEYSFKSKNEIDENWILGTGGNISFVEKDISFDDDLINLHVRLSSANHIYKSFEITRPSPPDNIEVLSYIYNSNGGQFDIELKGLNDKMEYSIDNGIEWTAYTSDTISDLDSTSDLIVRYKFLDGNDGHLSSIPTKKLNTSVYLGDISIDAPNKKLVNTNNKVEYSLDSSDGSDGTWQSAHASLSETSVNLKLGDKIWLREKDNIINNLELGEIKKKSKPSSLNYVYYNILTNKIANNTDLNLEYTMDGINWIKVPGGQSDLQVDFKAGVLQFRVEGKDNFLASDPVEKKTLVYPEAPKIKAVDGKNKKIEYYEADQWNELDDNFLYKIGANGEWISGNLFNIPKDINSLVYVKKVATPKELESKKANVSFSGNLNFDVLEVNVSENLVLGTTNKMEYSFDSTDGLDGTWTQASSNSTKINFTKGLNVWFREIGKPSVDSLLIKDLKRENLPSLANGIHHNIAKGIVVNNTNQRLEYRIANGDWVKLNPTSTNSGVNFKEGLLEFRRSGTKTTLPSLPITKEAIKAKSSKPVVAYNDVKNIVTKIDGTELDNWNNYEYRLIINNDVGLWTPGKGLSSDDLSGRKTVEIRKKVGAKNLSSQIASIEFTPNLVLDHVRLSKNVDPLELNGTTNQMEYSFWLYGENTFWQYKDGWLICEPDTHGNTKLPNWLKLENIYKIEIRDKEQKDNKFQIYKKP